MLHHHVLLVQSMVVQGQEHVLPLHLLHLLGWLAGAILVRLQAPHRTVMQQACLENCVQVPACPKARHDNEDGRTTDSMANWWWVVS